MRFLSYFLLQDDISKEAWMAEVSKDAEKRAHDRKIRREKADTLNTQAIKAFRRGEYEKALSCYNRAIEQVKDNPMLYCDRALTNIKLEKYEKVTHSLQFIKFTIIYLLNLRLFIYK